MTTPTWDDLPTAVRARLENDLAPTGPAAPVAGGFTPGVRVQLPTDDGTVFIKAIRSASGAADMYRAEAAANQVLPAGIGPQLLISFESDGWVVLAFDFLPGRHPDLTPGSPDLQPVIDAISRLHTPLTPCPLTNAPDITTNPVLHEADHQQFTGDALLHCDLRADNLLIAEDGQIRVIDWAWPHRGPAWIDTAFLVPQLVLAGHTAHDAEKWAGQVPAYQQADDTAINAFATALTRYWVSRAAQGSPELRAYRARAADAGRTWVSHRSAT
ncbi:hypothetical protein HRW23_34520 [Streptomyces lunaelactis]|uniref:hypothetical protein n=1 Tax=Streptomyces lunaelactis TaxID=1535768 RepID=UPI0015855331|nr:hypothetical protein [Streptomyces lunaelactis]NUK02941.1 hypothetical protein [Streptomyces lunaelactis]NUK07818.1 hypothetical protein [Streptomyces lunaelactis]NUK17152.1 hypothetical protein [Streptomyces lunaelactis]NUK34129.1 hypothetical protein [Streptomyces lunaelactis]NUK40562.1 hypothetical protein [Streptomyces lunaelactis]